MGRDEPCSGCSPCAWKWDVRLSIAFWGAGMGLRWLWLVIGGGLGGIRGMQPRVEKRLCWFFESKNFGVCNAFLHTKLGSTRNFGTRKLFFDSGAECLYCVEYHTLLFFFGLFI